MSDVREYTERELEIIGEYREKLLSGEVFRGYGRGAASIIGYQPPTGYRSLAPLLEVVAKMGSKSSALMTISLAVLRSGVSQSFTPGENAAKVWFAAEEAVKRGYFDAVLAGSPEPGRRSDQERAFTEAELLTVLVYLSEATRKLTLSGGGVGWCASYLAREAGVSEEVR